MTDRRQFLGHCLGSALIASGWRFAEAATDDPGRLAFRLREAQGLRRFGYPVLAVLPDHKWDERNHYRLLSQGKEIPSQFRTIGPGPERVILAFNASPGPLETHDYAVEFGPSVAPGVEPTGGLTTHRDARSFQVRSGNYLTYSIPSDLAGLISSFATSDFDYFAPGSRGLFLTDRRGAERTTLALSGQGGDGSAAWRWEGPVSSSLRFTGTSAIAESRLIRSTVDLTFVNSKSWIETVWTVEDPDDRVGSMGFDLNFLIQGGPAIVDCGASSTVYSHLKAGEVLAFEGHSLPDSGASHPRWLIEQGSGSALKPFAVARPGDGAAEGWVHVMDSVRSSAIAVAGFASSGPDRFTIEAGGRVAFERRFPVPPAPEQPKGLKTLKFWIHVVTTPVQVGAVTSPQAMLAPLLVDWSERS